MKSRFASISTALAVLLALSTTAHAGITFSLDNSTPGSGVTSFVPAADFTFDLHLTGVSYLDEYQVSLLVTGSPDFDISSPGSSPVSFSIADTDASTYVLGGASPGGRSSVLDYGTNGANTVQVTFADSLFDNSGVYFGPYGPLTNSLVAHLIVHIDSSFLGQSLTFSLTNAFVGEDDGSGNEEFPEVGVLYNNQTGQGTRNPLVFIHAVPEPEGLALVAPAIAALAWSVSRRGGNRHAGSRRTIEVDQKSCVRNPVKMALPQF